MNNNSNPTESTKRKLPTHERNFRLIMLAILTAILIVMSFTPLGYFYIGTMAITLNMIPVAVGAILLGPAAGAFLGGVFGVTSFIKCFMGDLLGGILLSVNPFLTAVTCILPRILTGFLVGLIFAALSKVDKTKIVSYGVASVSAALLNTALFFGALIVCFIGNGRVNDEILSAVGQPELAKNAIIFIVIVPSLINAAIECAVSLVAGTAISKAVVKVKNSLYKV